WELMRRSIDGLMDRALSETEVAAIERTLAEASPPGCFHGRLATRAAGALHFAHVELCVPGEWTVAEAHAVADALEGIVLERTGTRLSTHLEPLPPNVPQGAGVDLGRVPDEGP
ncbi:MAG TPA: cation transporter dimerization domain-containing protein, partial [Thauera aminoaromatica]|nr:cation transporter dimerization domain-containing protein [Thauera aminoaromatica]